MTRTATRPIPASRRPSVRPVRASPRSPSRSPSAQVDQVVDIAKNVYNFNAGDLFNSIFTEYDQKFIGKLDLQINDNQRITASYQHTAGETLTVNSGSTSSVTPQVTLPSNWYINNRNSSR